MKNHERTFNFCFCFEVAKNIIIFKIYEKIKVYKISKSLEARYNSEPLENIGYYQNNFTLKDAQIEMRKLPTILN